MKAQPLEKFGGGGASDAEYWSSFEVRTAELSGIMPGVTFSVLENARKKDAGWT